MFRVTSVMRLFMVMMLAFGLTAGAVSVASAQNISTGVVDVGGNTNNNGTDQGNTQSQDQVGDQGQTVDQDNTNNLDQDNTGTANAGSLVNNDCDASLVEDTDGDDVADCASGDASAGDSSVGDSDQSNAGYQSGHNSNSQYSVQNGGNQASAPSNSNEQNGVIDVTDIGGDITTDDDNVDNDGELDNSNNSQNNDGIQGDDNDVGGAEAISALVVRLFEILAAIIGNNGGGMEPDPIPSSISLVNCAQQGDVTNVNFVCSTDEGDLVACQVMNVFNDAGQEVVRADCQAFGADFDCGIVQTPTAAAPVVCNLVV